MNLHEHDIDGLPVESSALMLESIRFHLAGSGKSWDRVASEADLPAGLLSDLEQGLPLDEPVRHSVFDWIAAQALRSDELADEAAREGSREELMREFVEDSRSSDAVLEAHLSLSNQHSAAAMLDVETIEALQDVFASIERSRMDASGR